MKEIEQYVQTYFGIQGSGLEKVSNSFSPASIKKNEFIIKEGQYGVSLSFVKEGIFRMFALDKNGNKEVTQWIATKGMFLTDLSSLIFNAPSRWNIQALTDCEIYTISKENYLNINEHVPNWMELEKLFIAKCFVTLENRVFNQISMTAEEKYIDLLDQNPDILNIVPLQYIASMLGMTPETFSRVRKKLSS